MDKIHSQRLTKLVDHLESGKLGHRRFDFSAYNRGGTRMKPCGTAGCAVGECPILWPDEWTWDSEQQPRLRSLPANVVEADPFTAISQMSAIEWFGLTGAEAEHLFVPFLQQAKFGNGEKLYANATRREVAANIRAFLELKAKEQC